MQAKWFGLECNLISVAVGDYEYCKLLLINPLPLSYDAHLPVKQLYPVISTSLS